MEVKFYRFQSIDDKQSHCFKLNYCTHLTVIIKVFTLPVLTMCEKSIIQLPVLISPFQFPHVLLGVIISVVKL